MSTGIDRILDEYATLCRECRTGRNSTEARERDSALLLILRALHHRLDLIEESLRGEDTK